MSDTGKVFEARGWENYLAEALAEQIYSQTMDYPLSITIMRHSFATMEELLLHSQKLFDFEDERKT